MMPILGKVQCCHSSSTSPPLETSTAKTVVVAASGECCSSQQQQQQPSMSQSVISNCSRSIDVSVSDSNPNLAGPDERDGSRDVGEEEWKRVLTADQFRVMRERGTEPAHRNEFDLCDEEGVYCCAACGSMLYTSEMKAYCGCGWPGFEDCLPKAVAVVKNRSTLNGLPRELICNSCNSHLGHMFVPPRQCVNSTSLRLKESNPNSSAHQSTPSLPSTTTSSSVIGVPTPAAPVAVTTTTAHQQKPQLPPPPAYTPPPPAYIPPPPYNSSAFSTKK